MEPFSLRLGSIERFPEPVLGAFLSVADPAGGIERLRSCVLGPPFSRRTRFGLHLTLLHPAQGVRLQEAWEDLSSLRIESSFVANRVELIAGVGAETRTLGTVAFGGRVLDA